jgi:hypothetical protein
VAPNKEKPHTTPFHYLIYSIYISVGLTYPVALAGLEDPVLLHRLLNVDVLHAAGPEDGLDLADAGHLKIRVVKGSSHFQEQSCQRMGSFSGTELSKDRVIFRTRSCQRIGSFSGHGVVKGSGHFQDTELSKDRAIFRTQSCQRFGSFSGHRVVKGLKRCGESSVDKVEFGIEHRRGSFSIKMQNHP